MKNIYESGELSEDSDWDSKLDAFLQFNDAEVLQDKRKVTATIAETFAESEFDRLVASVEEKSLN